MDIKPLILEALASAQDKEDVSGSTGEGDIHRNRSKNFVECLAEQLRQAHAKRGNVASMSKHNEAHRERFGMNELLFDISVIQYDTVGSGTSDKELSFVTKGLWIVESEMAKNKREALYDFNKLVLGKAEKKLFVGPRVSDREEDDYLRVLGKAAGSCDGELYVALIPHPDEWPDARAERVKMWAWRSGNWEPVA